MDRKYEALMVTRNHQAITTRLSHANVTEFKIVNAPGRDHQRLADEDCDSVTLGRRKQG